MGKEAAGELESVRRFKKKKNSEKKIFGLIFWGEERAVSSGARTWVLCLLDKFPTPKLCP